MANVEKLREKAFSLLENSTKREFYEMVFTLMGEDCLVDECLDIIGQADEDLLKEFVNEFKKPTSKKR